MVPKYKAKVIGAIQAEAQRPGVRLLEVMLLHGGPVTQLEQRTMPRIIAGAVSDLRKKGMSIGFPGQGAEITIFMRCVEYTEFFDRFLGKPGVPMVADSSREKGGSGAARAALFFTSPAAPQGQGLVKRDLQSQGAAPPQPPPPAWGSLVVWVWCGALLK